MNARVPDLDQYMENGELRYSRCTAEEKLEFKRMKNKIASRNCRKRKSIEHEILMKNIQSLTAQYTKIITECYQLRTRLSAAEAENKQLRLQNEHLKQTISTIVQLKSDRTKGSFDQPPFADKKASEGMVDE